MSKIKAVLVADIHLRDIESIGGIGKNTLCPRTLDKINALQLSINFALLNSVDYFIILGDLFNSTRFSEELRHAVSSMFYKLIVESEARTQIIFVGGNHDTNDNISYILSSESELCDNLVLATNYTINIAEQNLWLVFLSSGQENEFNKFDHLKNKILFSHFQLTGAHYDNERISERFISPNELASYSAVFLGHFHKRQRINHCRYIGALCRNDFGERNNEDGFLYLEIENGGISKEEYISINDRIFEVYSKEVMSEKEIYDFINSIYLENKIVKIEFKIDDFPINSRKIKEFIKSKNPFHAECLFNKEITTIKSSIQTNLSYMEVFNSYIKLNKISKHLADIGKEISMKVFQDND